MFVTYMNNIHMFLSTKHLFSKLNGLVDSCHGLKIWHIHFPKGCALVDHGTHISDLSIFVCLQCTHTATKEVRVKHGIAKCPNKGSIEVHIIKLSMMLCDISNYLFQSN